MRSLLVLILLAFYFIGYGQVINFPDPNFKNALVNSKCVDTNGDGILDADADLNNDKEISIEEALTITYLKLTQYEISNITGLEKFGNLKYLYLGEKIQTKDYNFNVNKRLETLSYFFSGKEYRLFNCDSLKNLNLVISKNCTTIKIQNNLKLAKFNLLASDDYEDYNLRSLIANHNAISEFNMGDIKWAAINTLLDLSFNKLENGISNTYIGSIDTLKASHNKLKFIGLSSGYKIIDISYNNVENIDAYLDKCELLNLEGNPIEYVNISRINTFRLESKVNSIKKLRIGSFDKICLENTPAIEDLYLEGNLKDTLELNLRYLTRLYFNCPFGSIILNGSNNFGTHIKSSREKFHIVAAYAKIQNNNQLKELNLSFEVYNLSVNNFVVLNCDSLKNIQIVRNGVQFYNVPDEFLLKLTFENLKQIELLKLSCTSINLKVVNCKILNFELWGIGYINETSKGEIYKNSEIENIFIKNFILRNNKFNALLGSLESLKTLKCELSTIDSMDINGINNLEKVELINIENHSLSITNCLSLDSLIINGIYSNTNFNIKKSNLNAINTNNVNFEKISFSNILNLKSIKIEFRRNIKISLQLDSIFSLNSIELSRPNHESFEKVSNVTFGYLPNLNRLEIRKFLLNEMNLENLFNLKFLLVPDNYLKNLYMPLMSNIQVLNCSNNRLKDLDVSYFSSLSELNCSSNLLQSLNMNGALKLETLYCSNNNIQSLFIKTTSINQKIYFNNNNDLRYICCNNEIISIIKSKALSNGQNIEVNSYCTFTTGSKYYLIKGNTIFDYNNNGCDNIDIGLLNQNYYITNSAGNIVGTFIYTGNYSIPIQEGTHTITPILENPDHFEVTPSSFTITFPSTSDTITQNFCITPKGIFRQTNITVIPLTPPARPGFDASYKIVWENVGNQIESGTLNFTYDERLLDYISATQTADLVADGIIKWNFSNLLPFEKREITVTLKVNRPTDTPAVNAGDKLYLTASILDNIFTLENTVVGSYDPNDKTCLQGDRVKPDMVGKYVDYLIRFENTGNYAAENVVIKDIIDTKTFDVSSLQITDASHEVYTRIEGNKVEFIFENIQLPFDDANNDGYVAFKIKTLPTLVLGDSLKNLADIYFDYNFPIRTNEAQTTIALPSFTKDIATEINIYPNPVRDILYLESDENWSKAEIYDISGRIMRSVTLFGQSLDVSELESGTYFMRLKDGERVGLVKFVKL